MKLVETIFGIKIPAVVQTVVLTVATTLGVGWMAGATIGAHAPPATEAVQPLMAVPAPVSGLLATITGLGGGAIGALATFAAFYGRHKEEIHDLAVEAGVLRSRVHALTAELLAEKAKPVAVVKVERNEPADVFDQTRQQWGSMLPLPPKPKQNPNRPSIFP